MHMPHVVGDAIHHLHVVQGNFDRHTPEAILNAKEGLRCVCVYMCVFLYVT